jgi:hypothetical protein
MSDPAGPPDTRPPTKPPTTPPPKPPTNDATYADALLDEVDLLLADFKPPARQDFSLAAVGPDGPGPFFTLPATPRPPRFDEGEHRLVGRVGGPDEAEAEALARILRALHT